MRKNAFILGLILLVVSFGSWAVPVAAAGGVDNGTWELGVILGEPTGLSAKYWTTTNTALDFGAAWSFGKDGNFHLHCDYLYHNYNIFKVDEGSLPLYFGIGGRVRFEDDHSINEHHGTRVGLRLVLGLEYLVAAYPMSIFFEIAPIVDVAPATEGSMNGGLGIRYVF
ncbi:MAG: DUF3996 domain-containing protein [Candidatus Krumholzibacteriia bacterium]